MFTELDLKRVWTYLMLSSYSVLKLLCFFAVGGLPPLPTKPLSDCRAVKQSPITTGNSVFQVPVYSAHAATLQRLVITICSGLYILTPWLTFLFSSLAPFIFLYLVEPYFFPPLLLPSLHTSLLLWRHLSFRQSNHYLNSPLLQGPVSPHRIQTLLKEVSGFGSECMWACSYRCTVSMNFAGVFQFEGMSVVMCLYIHISVVGCLLFLSSESSVGAWTLVGNLLAAYSEDNGNSA